MNQKVLIAGIGNIFRGDDAFGVEVVRRLAERSLPDGVHLRDFGIRGLDLAYALNDGWPTVILVDALPRNGEPGTVYVLEPDPDDFDHELPAIDAHGMHPLQCFRLARSMGELPERVLVVGCEPADLGGDEGAMGLSAAVAAVIETAVETVYRLAQQALATSTFNPKERV